MLRRTALAALLPLALAPAARAADVVGPAGVEDAALAVDARGDPAVAYLSGGALFVATRAGGWRAEPVPARGESIDGVAAAPAGPVVLLRSGRTLTLAQRVGSGWRVLRRRIAPDRLLGPAGLALAGGVPVVAYSTAIRRKSFLFLLRVAGGRFRAEPITKLGFPGAPPTPSATPVVVRGSVHVVQVFGFGAIEWFRQRGKWVGQFLFASQLGAPLGSVGAAAAGGAVYAAWTQDYPSLGQTAVWLAVHRNDESSDIVLPHALFAALAVPPTGPEVAGNDFVSLPDGLAFAALVGTAERTVELDGRIEGLAALADGTRLLLLALPTGLELDAVPALLPVGVTLTATRGPAGVALAGHVDGATPGGSVDVYRESARVRDRVLIDRVALGTDNSFAATDPSPVAGTIYRAVYREVGTGLPHAFLLRAPPD